MPEPSAATTESRVCPECDSHVVVCDHLVAIPEGGAMTMNLAERAITSARAAQFTKEFRSKVGEAMEAPQGERESLLIDALEAATEACDLLTALLLDARGVAA